MILRTLSLILLTFLFSRCMVHKVTTHIESMEQENKEHTGFMLYDPVEDEVIIEHRADRYYTPASNTKIFTMYTALNVLGDSIPGLYYRESGDSLIFWGTGDPSFLYEDIYTNRVVYDFLARQEKDLYFSAENFSDDHFGPGWSWADYRYSYQVEISSFPVFGNYFYVSKKKGKSTLSITNSVFREYFWLADSVKESPPIIRDYGTNYLEYFPQEAEEEFERLVPFKTTPFLVSRLLADTLKRKVRLIKEPLSDYSTLYSNPIDTLFKAYMPPSDNFIAEQLLLTSAGVLSDTLDSRIAIDWALENLFADFPDTPLWFDGSGLSRYNQFTPRTIVKLWKKLYDQMGEERLFPLLAIGGKAGTIRSWYDSNPPYVFGKTGTLRNHHSLSGFIKTESGKTLIFSFMNSHYPGSSNDLKPVMQEILEMIRDNY